MLGIYPSAEPHSAEFSSDMAAADGRAKKSRSPTQFVRSTLGLELGWADLAEPSFIMPRPDVCPSALAAPADTFLSRAPPQPPWKAAFCMGCCCRCRWQKRPRRQQLTILAQLSRSSLAGCRFLRAQHSNFNFRPQSWAPPSPSAVKWRFADANANANGVGGVNILNFARAPAAAAAAAAAAARPLRGHSRCCAPICFRWTVVSAPLGHLKDGLKYGLKYGPK